MATEIGTVSTKGQVTIPKDVRNALHLRPGDKVLFDLEAGDRAVVRKAETDRLTQILDRLGPMTQSGVDWQRRLRREWRAVGGTGAGALRPSGPARAPRTPRTSVERCPDPATRAIRYGPHDPRSTPR